MKLSIGRRLDALEAKTGIGHLRPKVMVFDGTAAEVKKQIVAETAKAEANGEHLMSVVLVPHIGQSPNDFRKSRGLSRMDFEGWDEPRVE
jgi:hypothetical protein